MEQIIYFVKYYKIYIAILVLILIVFYIWYNLLYSVRTNSSIQRFEKKFSSFNDKIKRDFCNSSKFQNYSLADFYISSSYNPFLIGYLKYDYASLNMIKKVITYGARYIELQIFNKDIRNFTEPVIGLGNENNQIINTQNTLDCEQVFTVISERIFSEKYIDNYTDPFFIFLNLKTNNNINTLNKLHDIIVNIFRDRLLDDKYSYQKNNIANTPMCKLMNKVIIFSSDGYKFSKLERIINLSTTNSNLKRLSFNELPKNNDILLNSTNPLVELESNKIKLSKNFLYIQDETNFIDLNLDSDLVVVIKNAKNEKNNTPRNSFLNIEKISDKVIEFNDIIEFIPEDPNNNNINIKFYSKQTFLSNLHEKNKAALTIVYTNNSFHNGNFDYVSAFKLGCQFVCMNFQNPDKNLEKYIKKFKNNSIIPKPSNLRNDKDWNVDNFNFNKNNNLGPSGNIQKVSISKITVIKDFLNNFTTVNILPFNTTLSSSCCVNKIPNNSDVNCSQFKNKLNCLSGTRGKCVFLEDMDKCNKNLIKVIVKKSKNNLYLALSPNFKNSNSFFDLEEGLSKQEGSISLKFRNKYLVSDLKQEKCYLVLMDLPNTENEELIEEFNKSASFYPVTPKCNKEDYISFMQFIKGNEYYIKYRSEYDYKYKLYKKSINFSNTKLIGEIFDPNSELKLTFYEPLSENGFKSIGTIFISGENSLEKLYSSKSFNLYKGAVAPPIDFKFLKKIGTYSFWKSIPTTGFVSLGVIVTNNDLKPNINNYCCISIDYLEKQTTPLDDQLLWNNSDKNLPLSIWNFDSYFKISLVYDKELNKFVPPNEFTDIVYTIKDSQNYPKNILEQLYMEKLFNISQTEQNNTCFKIIPEKVSQKNVVINENIKKNLKKLNKKIKLSSIGDNLTNMCLGLTNIYWTKYYSESKLNSNNSVSTTPSPNERDENINSFRKSDLQLVDCKTNSYIGTNFDFINDGTIRLTNNNKYCLTNNNKVLELNICEEDKQNQIFNYDTESKKICLKDTNQCFVYDKENKIIKIIDNEEYNDKNINQWIVDQTLNFDKIYEVNNLVLYKQLIPRGDFYELKNEKSNNTGKYNFLNEVIDYDNFHIYTLAVITEKFDNLLNIKSYTSLIGEESKEIKVSLNNRELILLPKNRNNEYFKSKLIPGTQILCKNKGINYPGFEDINSIYWEGVVINNENINKNFVTILFSINSIEANLNRKSLGRPRNNNPLLVSIFDLVLKN